MADSVSPIKIMQTQRDAWRAIAEQLVEHLRECAIDTVGGERPSISDFDLLIFEERMRILRRTHG